MWRELIRPLALFDWITPTFMLVRRITSGRSHAFLVPEGAGWTGGQVVQMLREQGSVRSWGHMVINRHYYFRVPRADAVEAQRIMDEQGVPTVSGRPRTVTRTRRGLAARMGWR